jgi:hypothetical protein
MTGFQPDSRGSQKRRGYDCSKPWHGRLAWLRSRFGALKDAGQAGSRDQRRGNAGLAAIRGHGVELVITLGTGVGSGLFEDGRPSPHLELAHHPFRNGETYEEQLGNKAFLDVGTKRWNKRVERAIKTLRILTTFDRLYFGGGNADKIEFDLPADVERVPNVLGLRAASGSGSNAPLQNRSLPPQTMTVFLVATPIGNPR